MVRRRRQWVDTIVDEDIPSGGLNPKQLIPAAFQDEIKGLTIVRMVFGLDIIPLVPQAGSASVDLQLAGLGVGIVSDEAVAAGALPDPLLEASEPVTGWLWRSLFIVNEAVAGTAFLRRVELDLRSQRKMMYGTPQLLIGNTAVTGVAFTLSVRGIVRMLVLQP